MANALNIRLVLDGDQFRAELRSAGGEVERFSASAVEGGGRAEAGMRAAARGASSLPAPLQGAKQALIGFASAFASIQGLRQLVTLADQASNLRSQLLLATASQSAFVRAQAEVFAISQRTSTALASTTELYARITRSTAEYGIEQARVLRLTETINQTFAVSGTAAVNQANAITQLTQAFAGGVLRAEEFNSVIENSPRLAQALADGLGVGIGALRQMVNDGEVSVAKMIAALESQADAVEAEFARMPLTIERAWVQIGNAVLKYVGDADQASGASRDVAGAMAWVARNIDEIVSVAVTLAQVLGTLYAARLLTSAAAFTAELIAQAIASRAAAAAAVEMGLKQQGAFAASIKEIGKVGAALNLLAAGVAGWQIGSYLRDEFRIVADAGDYLVFGVVAGLARIERGARDVWAAFVLVATGAINTVRTQIADLVGLYASVGETADVFGLNKGVTSQLRAFEAQLRPTKSALDEFNSTIADNAARYDAASAAASTMLVDLQDATAATFRGAEASGELGAAVVESTDAIAGQSLALQQSSKDLDEWTAFMTAAAKEEAEGLARINEARLDNQALHEQQRLDIEQEIRLAGMSEVARRRELIVLEATRMARNQNGEVIEAERQRYIALLTTLDETEAATEAATRHTEDLARAWDDFAYGLADAVLDGSDGVKRYFKQLLDDLKRQIIASGLMSLFRSIFNVGGGSGGGFGSLLGTLFSGAGGSAGGGGFNLSSLTSLFTGGGSGGGFWSNLLNSGGGNASWLNTAARLFGIGGTSAAATGSALLSSGYAIPAATYLGAGSAATYGVAATSTGVGAGVGAGAASGGLTAASVIPVVGWIIAGMMANEAAFAGGWRGNSPTGADGGFARWASMPGGPVTGDQFLQALGFNERWASTLSGSALHTRLWGRRQPVVTGSDTSFNLGPDGPGGSSVLDIYRRGGLFRSSRRYQENVALGDEAAAALQGLFDRISTVMADAVEQLNGDAKDVQMISAAFRIVQENDTKGRFKATRYFVDMLGRSWEEATEELAISRLYGESIIAAIDHVLGVQVPAGVAAINTAPISEAISGAIGGGIRGIGEFAERLYPKDGEDGNADAARTVGEASAIAERWRGNAEELAAGAQMLLAIVTDMRNGFDLLATGTLTPIVALIDDVALEGETMIDTYRRIAASSMLLDQALSMSGVRINQTREDIVRLSVDIADAAGGLDRAQQLWQTYFSTFFTVEEQLDAAVAQARATANARLQGTGFSAADFAGDGIEGREAFRAAMNAALRGGNAEEIARMLEAGAAIADLLAAERQLADFRAQEAQAAIDAAEAALAAQAEARQSYAEMVRGLREELETAGLSEFALEMREIGRWTIEMTARLNATAVAAGMQADAENDLALVHQVAAQRAAAAIARLRNAARELVEQLQGSELQQIEAQIAAAVDASTQTQIGGIESVANAASQLWQQQRAAIESIRAYLDGQLLGDLSTLTPAQRLAEAQRQFDAASAAAAAGDVSALADLPRLADLLLRQGRDYFASGEQYTAIEAAVRAALQAFAGMSIGADPGSGAVGTIGSVGTVTVSSELQALYDQRDALLAQLEADRRAALAQQIAQMVRELVAATGDNLADIAASIRLDMTGLVTNLGVNLGQLTAETALSLAGIAQTLGVDIAELAASVGVDLGGLGDRQSLLNQALDRTVASLPDDIRLRLLGPLDALRGAVTDIDITDAMFDLQTITNDLPAGIRDLLAPFFDFIDPSPVISELSTLRDLDETSRLHLAESVSQTAYLQAISQALNAANEAAGLPSYEVGTGRVPRTGPALLHRDEMVFPAPVADFFRREGIPQATSNGPELVTEIRELRREQAEQARRTEELLRRLEIAEREGSREMSTEFRRSADAGRSIR